MTREANRAFRTAHSSLGRWNYGDDQRRIYYLPAARRNSGKESAGYAHKA